MIKKILNNKFLILKTIFLSILISVIITLGLLIIVNPNDSYAKMLINKKEPFVQIEKTSCGDEYNCFTLPLTESDEQIIKSNLINYYDVYKVNDLDMYLDSSEIFKINTELINENMYLMSLDIDVVVASDFDELLTNEIIGRYPKNENEILISNYLADLMIISGLTTYENESYYPNSYEDIINDSNSYYFGDSGRVKIVGIIDYDLSKYENLKKCYYGKEDTLCDSDLTYSLVELTHNQLNKVYALPSFVNSKNININGQLDQNNYKYQVINENVTSTVLVKGAVLQEPIEYYDGVSWQVVDTLNNDEIILNVYQLINDYNTFSDSLDNYLKNGSSENKKELVHQFLEKYLSNINIIGKEVTFQIKSSDGEIKETTKLKVIGISLNEYGNTNEYYYVSSDVAKEYQANILQRTGYLVLLDENNILDLLDEYFLVNDYIVETSYTEDYLSALTSLEFIKDIAPFIILFCLVIITYLFYSHVNKFIKSNEMNNFNKFNFIIKQSTLLLSLSSLLSIILVKFMIVVINNFISPKLNVLQFSYKGILILIVLDIVIFLFTYIFSKLLNTTN